MKRLFAVVFTAFLLFATTQYMSVSAAAGISYTDAENGVSFTVPANWKTKDFFEDRQYLDVKFASTEEEGYSIIYGSTDMWSQLSASDRIGYDRSDINNAAFTRAEIAAMYDITADKIATVNYNGVEYYKGLRKHTSDTYGITVTITQLIHFNNGWMYMFQFSGTHTHELYADFESLLNSVQYPVVPDSPSGSAYDSADETADNSAGMVAVVVLLAMIVVIIVAIIITRKRDAEAERQASYTSPVDACVQELQNTMSTTVACKECGQALPLDSAFCHMCGAKVSVPSATDLWEAADLSFGLEDPPKKKSNKGVKVLLIIVGALLLLTMAVAIFVISLTSSTDENDNLLSNENNYLYQVALNQVNGSTTTSTVHSAHKTTVQQETGYTQTTTRTTQTTTRTTQASKKTCMALNCDNAVSSMDDYCSEHKCLKSGCRYERSYLSSYCSVHECAEPYCDNARKGTGRYCAEHTCAERGCSSGKGIGSEYCYLHECMDAMCDKRRTGDSHYCSEHKCAKSGCNSRKETLSNYCSFHNTYYDVDF